MAWERTNYSSGAPLEESVGYSRMVKKGPFVFVGGTTSVQADGSVHAEYDMYEQTKYILEKQIALLAEAGAAAEDVVSVKAYLTDMAKGPEAARAYSEFFKSTRPLCTMVGTPALNRPTQMIEIELTAITGE